MVRLAALESLKGMSLGNAAGAHNVPKSTVADHVARLKAGPLPDACLTPTPVIVDVGTFLVKAGDWRDTGEVLNLHAVCCTGKDGKVSRNTKNVKDRAMSEIRSLNSKFRDGTIDRRRLNHCIKHHETERKEFCGSRGTARGYASSHEANFHRQKTKSSTQLKFGEPLEAALGTWVRTMRYCNHVYASRQRCPMA